MAELAELIEQHQANLREAVELTTGESLRDFSPELSTHLKETLVRIRAEGVCYTDVTELQGIPEINSLMCRLNPHNYSDEATFVGLSSVTKALEAAITILP